MNEVTVYTIPGSPYARAVLAMLEEKCAPYRVVALTMDTVRTPCHLDRHPFGRMPYIDHGGFWLYETQAILRYLDRVLPDPPLTPPNLLQAARMDQIMNINDCYLFNGVSNVIGFERVVKPLLWGLPADEKRVAQAMPAARTVLAALEGLIGTHAYLAGERLTLADLMVAPQLSMMAQTPEWDELGGTCPRLDAWLEHVSARPCFMATTMEKVSAMARAAESPGMATSTPTQ